MNSPVFLEFQDGPAELLLQVAALLHGQRVRLLGEGLPDLSQVAVVVHLVSVKQSPLPSIQYLIMSKLLAFGMTGWVKFGLCFGFLRHETQ